MRGDCSNCKLHCCPILIGRLIAGIVQILTNNFNLLGMYMNISPLSYPLKSLVRPD